MIRSETYSHRIITHKDASQINRINLTLYKLDAILNGDLDEIIQALNAADQAAKMQEANTNA